MDQIVDQADVLLERLLFVMGKGDASAAERAEVAQNLRIMKGVYEQRIGRIRTVELGYEKIDTKRELLQKLHAKKAEVRDLRNQLGDRKYDIDLAGIPRMLEAKLPLEEFDGAIEACNIPHARKVGRDRGPEYRVPPQFRRRKLQETHAAKASDRTVPLLFASCGCSSASAQTAS